MNFFDEKCRKSSENFVQKVEISSQVNSAWQGVLSAGKPRRSSCIISGKATTQQAYSQRKSYEKNLNAASILSAENLRDSTRAVSIKKTCTK